MVVVPVESSGATGSDRGNDLAAAPKWRDDHRRVGERLHARTRAAHQRLADCHEGKPRPRPSIHVRCSAFTAPVCGWLNGARSPGTYVIRARHVDRILRWNEKSEVSAAPGVGGAGAAFAATADGVVGVEAVCCCGTAMISRPRSVIASTPLKPGSMRPTRCGESAVQGTVARSDSIRRGVPRPTLRRRRRSLRPRNSTCGPDRPPATRRRRPRRRSRRRHLARERRELAAHGAR